ncbi:MAG TPA: hypothetical protein DCM34_10720 [Salmonella bongori]|uniref:Uncharacterized protein n=1 Tax=Salmonella bongori serovar 66:z41:- str. SA19983605 TaxID=1243617 RepID=A0A248K584_SALBN|nr:hypothetical protein LFZ56_00855 [Salmonella bongori serovar 66:z41:- str. SA19983605]ECC9753050.1 hypothetical protein [Salmonella bongori]HAD95330.1 hypothetical protein [Salmonella bongori]HAK49650.1 hypothetical protein [Salmonella bongori]HBD15998.1 hypothetical protein [Salmonella bongori]
MRLPVNQNESAECANRNRLIINLLSNNQPADFHSTGSHVVEVEAWIATFIRSEGKSCRPGNAYRVTRYGSLLQWT